MATLLVFRFLNGILMYFIIVNVSANIEIMNSYLTYSLYSLKWRYQLQIWFNIKFYNHRCIKTGIKYAVQDCLLKWFTAIPISYVLTILLPSTQFYSLILIKGFADCKIWQTIPICSNSLIRMASIFHSFILWFLVGSVCDKNPLIVGLLQLSTT